MKISMIGTRNPDSLDQAWVALFRTAAVVLAHRSYEIVTGAAPGLDQLAGESALVVGGRVKLFLPWADFEREWADRMRSCHGKRVAVEVYSPALHPEWTESVAKYHPAPMRLTGGAVQLQARNFGIVAEGDGVIALPRAGEEGGTGQGIRIARALEKPVLVLTNAEDRAQLAEMITR